MAGKVGGRRKARAAHPLVVAALPQLLVVPRAPQERRELGEIRLTPAVLDVLVRDAQPLHELDEVKRPDAGEPEIDLDLLDGLEDFVNRVDERAVDHGLDQAEQRHGHLVEDHHHDVGRGALLKLVGQVVDPRGAQQHEDLRNCQVQFVYLTRRWFEFARSAPGKRTPPG